MAKRTKGKKVEIRLFEEIFFSSGPVEIKILANGCTGKNVSAVGTPIKMAAGIKNADNTALFVGTQKYLSIVNFTD